MSKIHYFQRYSSIENTVTNNTLQLFARIYSYSVTQASKLLSDWTGESIEIGIEINQQEHAAESVPDGTLLQRSFKLLIESKVDSGVDVNQLVRHSKSFSNESQKILLLLSKQPLAAEKAKEIQSKIAKIHPSAVFRNVTFESICSSIKGLFRDYEYEIRSLVEDYVEYCNDLNLFDQSKFLMRIVPCGESVDINIKHAIYFHPSDRGYTKHSFIGIYANKSVRSIWKLDSVFDIGYDGKKLEKTLIEGRDTNDYDERIVSIITDAKAECGYQIEQGHRFFCGKAAYATDYKKQSAGGIQGARFVNLKEVIGEYSDPLKVADKLKDIEWE